LGPLLGRHGFIVEWREGKEGRRKKKRKWVSAE
jgi:hypothetical protein